MLRVNTIKLFFLIAVAVMASLNGWHAPMTHALTDAEFAEMNSQSQKHDPAAGSINKAGPAATSPPNLSTVLAKLGIALGAVFALMAVILWAGRKFFPKSPLAARGGAIEIVATRTLGQRRSLVLVRAQGKTVLLGATPQQINFLIDFDNNADWMAPAEQMASQIGLEPSAPTGRTGSGRDT